METTQTDFAYEIASFIADLEGIPDDDRPDFIDAKVEELLSEVNA